MEIRRSQNHLISTMGFPTLVRRYLYIESGPWFQQWKGKVCRIHFCLVYYMYSILSNHCYFFFVSFSFSIFTKLSLQCPPMTYHHLDPSGTNFSEISIKIHFLSGKWIWNCSKKVEMFNPEWFTFVSDSMTLQEFIKVDWKSVFTYSTLIKERSMSTMSCKHSFVI